MTIFGCSLVFGTEGAFRIDLAGERSLSGFGPLHPAPIGEPAPPHEGPAGPLSSNAQQGLIPRVYAPRPSPRSACAVRASDEPKKASPQAPAVHGGAGVDGWRAYNSRLMTVPPLAHALAVSMSSQAQLLNALKDLEKPPPVLTEDR